MNLIFRLIRVLLASFWRAPLALFDESVVRFRVWPNDLDFNLHMSNGRYLSLMDLGRFDLMACQGLARLMLRNRWQPVVAAQTMVYRRALKPFQSTAAWSAGTTSSFTWSSASRSATGWPPRPSSRRRCGAAAGPCVRASS